MLDFLKPKLIIRPEELGIELADMLASLWFKKIAEHVSDYKDVSGIVEKELENLWRVFLMLHCTAISVGVESTGISEQNKKIILDAFWDSVVDHLREQVSENESLIFQDNILKWYPKLRDLMVDSSSGFTKGGLGPGKALFTLAMPNRELKENVEVADRLTGEFVSTYAALTKFAVKSVKKSKFTESLISYE